MNIINLFNLDYWFYQPFTARGLALWLLIGGFLLFLLAGLVFKILSEYQNDKTKKIVLKRLGSLGVMMGFLGLIWMFFRQERVAFLAWRFWLLLWALVFVSWLSKIIRYMVKRVPELKAEEERRARMEKYLPKKN